MIPLRPPSGRIRVLVVEDSTFMRMVIRQILDSDSQVEIVGLVSDGVKAVEAVGALAPHVVTMDVTGPHGDALAALARIMTLHPTPILMVSSYTREGSAAAIEAFELGAVDFVAKPPEDGDIDLDGLRDAVIRKVKMAARVRPLRIVDLARRSAPVAGAPRPPGPYGNGGNGRFPYAVIAASTGGPAALSSIIPALPADLPGSVLVIQHMPAPYTAQLTRAIGARSALPVKEAEEGERFARGVVYVAPGSRNLTLSPEGAVLLRPAAPNAGVCPSANLAMTSVARHAGPLALGVVLTGMGRDGAEGAAAIRRAGGTVIAQDEASSLLYGMPRAAIETGCVDAVVPLRRLPETLTARVVALTAALADTSHGA